MHLVGVRFGSREGEACLGLETKTDIASEADIVRARQTGRSLALQLGFGAADAILIATAISELARNIVLYARRGRITFRVLGSNPRCGLEVVADDEGPGIPDLQQAMEVGYSTSSGLGLGLPGVRRLMDEFQIASEVGRGTTVTARKWIAGDHRC